MRFKSIALHTTLAVWVALVGVQPRLALAGLIGTDAVVAPVAAEARSRILTLIEREDVQSQLVALGSSNLEARARVRALSDAEILALDERLENLPAGSSFAGAVLGVAVVTLVVLLFLDLLGVTDVYPFINPLPRADRR